jgi:hypothetical protein
MNKAKEMFVRLHDAGEILLAEDIQNFAQSLGWQENDANELGGLAQQIGMGKNAIISDGPWWSDNIIEILQGEIGA